MLISDISWSSPDASECSSRKPAAARSRVGGAVSTHDKAPERSCTIAPNNVMVGFSVAKLKAFWRIPVCSSLSFIHFLT